CILSFIVFFFSSRRRHTRFSRDWSSDVCSSDLTNGSNQIENAGGKVFGRAVTQFQHQALVREQRGKVFKQNFVFGAFRLVAVNFVNFQQGNIAFAFFGRAAFTADFIALAQVKAADLTGGYIDIVRAGEVRTVRAAQETKTILQNFQHTITVNIFAAFGMVFQNGEDDVLFTGAADVHEVHLLGNIQELRNGLKFQIRKIHKGL